MTEYTHTEVIDDFFISTEEPPVTEAMTIASDCLALNELSQIIHARNVAAGWWTDIKTGKDLRGKDEHGRDNRNVPELLCLIHSEVSEAMEGYRKNLMDDKLPHRSMFEVELADVFIRIFDLAGAHDLDLGGAVLEKLSYNKVRPDHQVENRLKDDGKKF
jgi:NTP pyrophosphatase (non-canonical NTP hydrolase)